MSAGVCSGSSFGPEHAHAQVAADIQRRIAAGEITVKLPAEKDLAQEYEVAYVTVRHARRSCASGASLSPCTGGGHSCAGPTRHLSRTSAWQTAGVTESAGMQPEGIPHASQAGEPSGALGHLNDETVVVRGGQMLRKDVIRAAEKYEARYPGTWGISVYSLPGASVDEIAQAAEMPHVDLRRSARGKILNARTRDGRGMKLFQTGTNLYHYTLVLPCSPSDDECWQLLDGVFDAPEQNPARWRDEQG